MVIENLQWGNPLETSVLGLVEWDQFQWLDPMGKALLIAAIASLFGLSCLTKCFEENDAERTRSSNPARSAPRWGVPKNTAPLIALSSEAYSPLLCASIIAYHELPIRYLCSTCFTINPPKLCATKIVASTYYQYRLNPGNKLIHFGSWAGSSKAAVDLRSSELTSSC
jgi:hypothetical protein